jgi:hypothetical protein
MKKILILAVLLLMAGNVCAGSYRTAWATWSFETDSIRLKIFKNGDSVLTRLRDSGEQSYDSTFTVYWGADTCYQITLLIYAAGEDTAQGMNKDLGGCLGQSYGGYADYADTIFAVDTSGTDAAIADVKLTIENAAGESIYKEYSNSSGYFVFTLDSGSYTIRGRRTGYVFTATTDTVTAAQRDTIYGYNRVVSTPSSADLMTIFGYLHDAKGDPRIGAIVTAIRVEGPTATADTGNTGVIVDALPYIVQADSLGYFELFLRRTGTYPDTTKGLYDITGTWDEKEIFGITKFHVPATGDSLNLADTLAVRGM